MKTVLKAITFFLVIVFSFTAFILGYGKEVNAFIKVLFILLYVYVLIRYLLYKTIPNFIYEALRGMELFLGRKKAIGFFVIVSTIGMASILVEFIQFLLNS